jgi:hypothetical protein
MSGRKAVIGLCMLCALVVSAFAAQSASADGTTLFTCASKAGGKGFSKAHCKTADAVASGASFGHVAVKNGTATDLIVTNTGVGTNTNETSIPKLKSTIAGSAIELLATGMSASKGTIENKEEGTEMVVHSKNLVLKYTGVTEKLLGCKVTGKPGGAGVVETKELTATTTKEGMNVLFKPENAEGIFAEFELTECIIGPVTVKVFGDTTGSIDGATITVLHETGTKNPATGAVTMRVGNPTTGKAAGYEGVVTVSGKDTSIAEDKGNPLSVTTEPFEVS